MRNIIQTKEDDLVLERDGGDGQAANDDEELEDEEDYTVGFGSGSGNTTLRRSAAYALAQFSKTF